MVKIYIGFSKHNTGFLSPLIRWVQGTDYSHVYLRKESKYGEYFYQASGLSVNFMNGADWRKHNTICEEYVFDISDTKHTNLITTFMRYAGKPYSIKALFEIAFKMLAKKLNFDLKLQGDGTNTFVCSELGAVVCKEVLEIEIKEDEDFMSPADLHPYIVKNGIKEH